MNWLSMCTYNNYGNCKFNLKSFYIFCNIEHTAFQHKNMQHVDACLPIYFLRSFENGMIKTKKGMAEQLNDLKLYLGKIATPGQQRAP